MALAVRALSGDVACLATLRRGLRGRVHSVFARVVNVIAPDGSLLTLASREVDDAADHARHGPPDLRRQGCGHRRAGRGARRHPRVGRRLAIRVDGARPWVPLLPWYPATDAPLRRGLDALRAHVAGSHRSPADDAPPRPRPWRSPRRRGSHSTRRRSVARSSGPTSRLHRCRAKRWSGWARG